MASNPCCRVGGPGVSLGAPSPVSLPEGPLRSLLPAVRASSPGSSCSSPLPLSPPFCLQLGSLVCELVHLEASSQDMGTRGPARGRDICQWEGHHGVFPEWLPLGLVTSYVLGRGSVPLTKGGGYQEATRNIQ